MEKAVREMSNLIQPILGMGAVVSIFMGAMCFMFPTLAGKVTVLLIAISLLIGGLGAVVTAWLGKSVPERLLMAIVGLGAIGLSIYFMRDKTIAADVLVYITCGFLVLYGIAELIGARQRATLRTDQTLLAIFNIALGLVGLVFLRGVDALPTLAYIIGASYFAHGIFLLRLRKLTASHSGGS